MLTKIDSVFYLDLDKVISIYRKPDGTGSHVLTTYGEFRITKRQTSALINVLEKLMLKQTTRNE